MRLRLYAWLVKRRYGYTTTVTRADNGRYTMVGKAMGAPFSITGPSLVAIWELLAMVSRVDVAVEARIKTRRNR
jgi:hypothetical protein